MLIAYLSLKNVALWNTFELRLTLSVQIAQAPWARRLSPGNRVKVKQTQAAAPGHGFSWERLEDDVPWSKMGDDDIHGYMSWLEA